MSSIRVLVADDHPVIAQGLADQLKPLGIECLEAVLDGSNVIERYRALKPDVLVLDLRMGSVRGLDVARELLGIDDNARIVFCSQFDQDYIVHEAYRIGGKAFVPKTASPNILAEAIKTAYAGGTYFLPDIAERIALISVRGDASPRARLNERELEVFKRMAMGLTYVEIAEEMGLSLRTISLVTQSVKESLGVSRPADITRLAIKHQLIDE